MISRYDPFREPLSLRRAMDQLFDQSFLNPSALSGTATMIAPMDVCETPNGYEVDVALPGVRPEDVEITVDQNTLTIRGRYSYQNEHREQQEGQGQYQQQGQWKGQTGQTQVGQSQAGQPQQQQGRTDRHKQGHNWLLKEIPSGTFERTITFPRPIDVNNIQTKFENGILTIMLPMSEASRPKRISLTGQGQAQQIPVEAGQRQQQTVESGQQRQQPR